METYEPLKPSEIRRDDIGRFNDRAKAAYFAALYQVGQQDLRAAV
jgi:hypothetical protein